ncbi:hypothetical protein L484_018721 [Morus notabilis]|uniref:Uncharacterized protein n=1 Tax=Morus notabilis TaxID=981085 RepID=W9RPE4_9ROSA|nr:hypothetical protein L484_018721 [Morus notabilis]
MSGNGKVCRFETAFKSMEPKRNIVPSTEPYGNKSTSKRANLDEKRRKEKAENLLHLICWGPN